MALKDSHTSSLETKLEVELATLVFNQSFFSTLSELCKVSEVHAYEGMSNGRQLIQNVKSKKYTKSSHAYV